MNSRQRLALIDWLIVLVLFTLAFAVRVYRLQEFPPGLYVDEAANGVDALEILDGRHAIFFERNTGREPILIYLQAFAILLFGATPYALRVVPALIGALTIPALYWMVREAFSTDRLPSRWLGLWTALFVAFSYWHISLSRLGFRAILLPLTATLAFIFFWRSWNRLIGNRTIPWLNLILCGIFTGLCLYTYSASRLTPIWIALTFLVGGIQVYRTIGLSRLLVAFGTITGVALVVFVPLGSYFWFNPEQFYGRAADVSIFNPYFAGDLPRRALASSVTETARMFVDRADPNLRHNPAGRPVFEMLMTAWLVAGIGLALFRIRTLPYFSTLAGFILFALPAVITAEGLPHSLRAIGMLTMAYILAVIAMMVAGQFISRWFRLATVWAPLPFLLISAVLGLQSYFGAWQDIDRFRGPFLSDFQLIDMSSYGEADGVWIWPFSPNYHWSDNTFYPLEYLHQGESDYGFVPVDDKLASSALADLTRNKREAYLVRTQDMPHVFSASYVMGDPKHLVKFLLEKHAVPGPIFAADDFDGNIPFQVYRLPAESNYSAYNQFESHEISYANRVMLLGADIGHIVIDLDADTSESGAGASTDALPAGEKLWLVLEWEAIEPVEIDLKTSLILRDEAGNLAGQVDDLLVGDRYPVERVWEPGEKTHSYHILPLWAGIPPGKYTLYLKVYEEITQRTYPVVDQAGRPFYSEAPLGIINVEPAVHPQVVNPGTPLDPALGLNSELELLGYDLPKTEIAPGEEVLVTLYWQARNKPLEDHLLSLSLVDTDAQVLTEMDAKIGGKGFPTGLWRTDEVVRDWQALAVPGEADAGTYELILSVGGDELFRLGEILVEGRRRIFDTPPISHPMDASFDQSVDLLGVVLPSEALPGAGETITFDLVWQVREMPDTSLIRFVHLLSKDGLPVAQQDVVPCAGDCPVHTWLKDEVLIDPVSIPIPENLDSGDYQLVVGWYDAESFLRRPVRTGAEFDNNGLIALPIVIEIP